MRLDHRKFAEVAGDANPMNDNIDIDQCDRIMFFRSPHDGEWYVEIGHNTAGAVSHVSAVYKVNDDRGLDELHEASEMVTVFMMSTWSES